MQTILNSAAGSTSMRAEPGRHAEKAERCFEPNALKERERFSERLREALKNAGYPAGSAVRLVREFNRRFPGRPVTQNAARKWVMGDAIPTQDKLRVLASWLGVSPDWLRFGEHSAVTVVSCEGEMHFDPEEMRLILELRQLDKRERAIVCKTARTLISACLQKENASRG